MTDKAKTVLSDFLSLIHEKTVTIYYHSSLDLHEDTLVVKYCDPNGKIYMENYYSRANVSEKKNRMLCIWLMLFVAIFHKEVNLVAGQRLRKSDREKVHEIFPFVFEYRGLKHFIREYEKNKMFDYANYEEMRAKAEACRFDREIANKREWNVFYLKDGTPFLCACWKEDDCAENASHMVAMIKNAFYSDMDYRSICAWEKNFAWEDEKAFLAFDRANSDIGLKHYVDGGGKRIFLYLTSIQTNHAFELLSKAGMPKIADSLENYQDLNLKANRIEGVFNLPIKALRAFERSSEFMLYTASDRDVIKWAYYRCPDLYQFGSNPIFEIWSRYCFEYKDLLLPNGKTLENIFAKSAAYLEKQTELIGNPFQVFVFYENYISYCIKLNTFVKGMFPKNLEGALQICLKDLKCIREQQKQEQYIKSIEKHQALADNEDGEYYYIALPLKPREVVEAGKTLHNCLVRSYASRIINGVLMIGLIYEKADHKLIGALEIRDKTVVQAKGMCNRPLAKDVLAYVHSYMERKGLSCGYACDL